jgi:uncharacterized protein (DUF849 family)
MTASRTWLEAAINGPWGRALQPGMPITIQDIIAEGIAAAEAGAAIIHFHAYDETTGRQKDEGELYARIIEGILARVDVIAYPTIPLAGSGLGTHEPSAASAARDRYRHIDYLGQRGLIEWGVVDPGTVNFARYDEIEKGNAGFVYVNPPEHIQEGLRLALQHKLHPSFAIYEAGFARLGAALANKCSGIPTPIYRLMFSDEYAWGFPPQEYALDAYLTLIQQVAPKAPWMIAGLGVDVSPLAEAALERGGHVRVGLEDAHFSTDRTNVDLVKDAVRQIRTAGREPATADDIRAELKSIGPTAPKRRQAVKGEG